MKKGWLWRIKSTLLIDLFLFIKFDQEKRLYGYPVRKVEFDKMAHRC